MNSVYLILGSNVGDRVSMINSALEMLQNEIGNITKRSSIYETDSWGDESLPPHLNQVVLIETKLDEKKLLHQIHVIENSLGRRRQVKWGSRTIDIDILFFNNDVIDDSDLTVPHKWMQERKFVLVPLAEIAKDYLHPLKNISVEKMLEECEDILQVKLYKTV